MIFPSNILSRQSYSLTIAIVAIFSLFHVGCSSYEGQRLVHQSPDATYKQIRLALQDEPTPEPISIYLDKSLQRAYLIGFQTGWTKTMEMWVGGLYTIPQEFQADTESRKAWRAGFEAAAIEVVNKVLSIAAQSAR